VDENREAVTSVIRHLKDLTEGLKCGKRSGEGTEHEQRVVTTEMARRA